LGGGRAITALVNFVNLFRRLMIMLMVMRTR
jgi:hypothetical protein